MCSTAGDLATDVVDGATVDDGTNADLAEVSGCKATSGKRLGAGQWACPGAFGSGMPKASDLCATGYVVCPQIDAAALASCNALQGFYASTVIGSRRDTATVGTGQCDQREILPVVYGCGMNSLTASMACSGYPRLIDCNSQAGVWICQATIDQTTNRNPINGVLCCK